MTKISGWEIAKINDVMSNRSEKFNPKTSEEEYRYIGLEHINQVSGTINGYGKSCDTLSMKTKFYENDILFGKLRPYLKKYWFADFAGVCSTEILALQPNANTDSRFCFYLIQDDEVQNQVAAKTFGTKMPRTSWNELKQYEVHLPPLPEQKKIAKILSTVDDHIDEVDGMIDDLKELKKGLMQKLLTEGIGHTNFKESPLGRIPVEWEVDIMSNIVSSTQLGTSTIGKEDIVGIPLIKMGNLTRGGFNFSKVQQVSLDDYEINEEFLLNQGDFLFNTRNTLELVGKSATWNNGLQEAIFNNNIMRIRYKKSVDSYYMSYYFEYEQGWKELKRIATGTTSVAAIYTKDLMKCKVLVPPLSEQKRIVRILKSLEDRVECYKKEYADLTALKKGLMQQLLTGKKRVIV